MALGVLAWLCIQRHAPALASAARAPIPAAPPPQLTVAAPPVASPPAPTPTPPSPPPAPLRVQAELDRLLTTGRVDFETGSNRLRPEAVPLLDAVAEALASAPELKVEVEGHTDSRGDAASNRRLSQRRAQAVKAYLVSRGIDSTRIHTVGSGSTRPLVRAHTAEAFEMNRRIEFRVLSPGGR